MKSGTNGQRHSREYRLERENAELRQANEILKDTLGFFEKDRKKLKQANGICLS